MSGPGPHAGTASTAAEPTTAFRQAAGWIAGAIVIVAFFVVGAAFWFTYHP